MVAKAAKRIIYDVEHDAKKGDWKVIAEGAGRASLRAPTKDQAVREAIALAKSKPLSQIRIKTKDGRIQREHTYPRRSDPERSPG